MHSPVRSWYIPAAILLILLLSTSIAKAQQTINVPASQPTIQAAINGANNGDTVMVAPGTYVENINFGGKAITVTSSGGPSVTTIDGGARGSVVIFSTGEGPGSVLNGFTVRNGLQDGLFGGGIYIAGASPTITGNIVTGNHAAVGCGVYVGDGSPLIQNNKITGNDQTGAGDGGQGGGGILVSGSNSSPANPQIIGNTITNNSVGNGGNGGGISVWYFSSPLIQSNLIQGNRAYNFGGGVALQSYNSPILAQNLIVNNVSLAGGSGGGLYISPASDSAQTSVTNNTIVANSAYDSTSGVDVGGFGQYATFTNNIIVAAAGQNAVSCISLYSSVSPVFSYNDAFAASGSAWAGICDTTSNPGNISVDPLFMSPVNNDFHLQAASPVVNAGNNSAATLLNTDFDGNLRIAGVAVDLGVYEVVPTSAANISPASLSFSLQAPGATSGPQTATLTSTGTTPFQITSVQITGPFSASSTCPTLSDPAGFSGIPAGNNCAYSVTFAPPSGSSPGTLTGTLTVNGTNGASLVVSLSGTVATAPATLSPTSLSFASQVVGTTSTAQSVVLTNPSNFSLTITSITASQQFSESDNCGVSLAAGASCTINVTFAPTSAGNVSGTLTVADNAANGPQSVPLGGTGLAPAAVSLSPSSLSFSTPLGTSSTPQTITVTNTGGAALGISGIAANQPFAVMTSTCTGNLAGGASCSVSISFTPHTSGNVTGAFTITDNASGSPQSVPLTGTTPAAVSLSPSSLTFSGQAIGTTSVAQSVSLTNAGGASLNISSISASQPFAQTNNCPASLAGGASCTLSITFTPQSSGSASGAVSITDNASGSPQSVTLTGTTPAIASLSPSSLAFPATLIGATATQTVTLTNTGGTSMNISGLSYPNPFSVPSTNCLGSLGAGASCQITIAFKPTASGPFSGVLQINDTASGSPHSVPLSGTGYAPPAVSLSTANLNFGSQLVGTTSAPQAVTLTNTGGASLTISGIAVAQPFAQSNNCPANLAAGANCTISVTFTPQASGARNGTLTITDNASNGSQGVSVAGSGAVAAPTLSPTSLSFGTQLVGTTSSGKTVKLTANSPGPLAISSISVSADFTQSNNCPASLNPGSSCNISIIFQPVIAGATTGVLTIIDNGLGNPHSVPLSGTGMDFSVSAAPSSVTINSGDKANYTITVSELGGSFNHNVSLSCSGLPAQSSCSFSPSGVNPGSGSGNSALTIKTTQANGTSGTPPGTYTITITGKFNPLVRSTTVTLVVD